MKKQVLFYAFFTFISCTTNMFCMEQLQQSKPGATCDIPVSLFRPTMQQSGIIFALSGPMFAGKTGTLIALAKKLKDAGIRFQAIKHTFDTERYGSGSSLCSHEKDQFPACCALNTSDLEAYYDKTAQVIIIDEAQFFDTPIVDWCRKLRAKGIHIVTAGLDKDCFKKPFGPMPELIALADPAHKIHLQSFCNICGAPADFTCRTIASQKTVFVGGAEAYVPRCAQHHTTPEEKTSQPVAITTTTTTPATEQPVSK
ncbi:MAG: Thymidine kinase [candidate division TM6 bacterium GW2011_GWE2_41_16]|nr:MAG: Thymidine kinase [candidate division TM6 bacterium GW2011_GWE2_41_16]